MTTKLALTDLANGQANYLNANTTFAQLNQLVQAGVIDKDLTAPPGSPADEALYIVGPAPTGLWASQAGKLAYWLTALGVWTFVTPREGFFVHLNDEDLYYKYTGTAWVAMAGQSGALAGAYSYGGTANAIVLTATAGPLTAYSDAVACRFRATATNTGATTVNVDGLGAKSVVTVTGAALPAGYIRTDVHTVITYDATGDRFVAERLEERGSNANGEFGRFADGTQICTYSVSAGAATTAEGSVFRTASAAWTFPAVFAAQPTVVNRERQGGGLSWGGLGSIHTTAASTSFALYAATSSATARIADLQANGRWY